MMYLLIPLFLVSLFILSMILAGKESNMYMSPFECGLNPLIPVRVSFSLQFVFITMLFLLFDSEIVLLMPFTMMYIKSTMIIGMILILMLSLMFEWNHKMLSWS